jgi:hypothetical protein
LAGNRRATTNQPRRVPSLLALRFIEDAGNGVDNSQGTGCDEAFSRCFQCLRQESSSKVVQISWQTAPMFGGSFLSTHLDSQSTLLRPFLCCLTSRAASSSSWSLNRCDGLQSTCSSAFAAASFLRHSSTCSRLATRTPISLSLVIQELIIDLLYLVRKALSQWPRFGTS